MNVSKTTSGGASITRLMRSSSVTGAAQRRHRTGPAVDPPCRLLEVRRAEPALSRPADLRGDHEIDLLEDADVLLDAVERQAERLGELADRGRSAAKALEDAAACRVREGEERPMQCLVML